MTPLREAFILPGLFLTVTLLGGLRIADTIRLLPPPLSAVVLAVLLVGALARAGVVVPGTLLGAVRQPLENLSGAVVLLTLLAASAQAINLVVPDRGLLHAGFVVFLFVQLLSLSAAGLSRPGMLRSLFVLLGSMFVLRFIIIESLYAADGGTLKRILTSLMAGVTLGSLDYQSHASVTGYAAFVTLSLYMMGLVLMPFQPLAPPSTTIARTGRAGLVIPLLVLGLMMTTPACEQGADPPEANPVIVADQAKRDAILASARVWMKPAVPPAQADLGANPPGEGAFPEGEDVDCRFAVEKVGGLTPKFNCQLADGSVVKVKYGPANPELYAEVAATRLVAALGFGADRVHVVRSVRCAGCPSFPFHALRCLATVDVQRLCFPLGIDYEKTTVFDPAVVERRLEGRKIEAVPDHGWAWYELDKIDPAKGGSPRAEIDALRLLAVFLAHWDNKAENQRLVCLPGGDLPDGGCTRPFAIMQDLGGSFGPTKLDLRNWRTSLVWADARACRVSMKGLPWGGATFPDRQIAEGGRQFLLRLIEQLSATQIESLFVSSGATSFDAVSAEGRSAAAWSKAFLEKVRQIREAGPCPDA